MVEEREIRGIVHLFGRDIKGELPLPKALREVKGIGIRTSNVFAKVAAMEMNIPHDTPIGRLTDEQIEKLKKIITNPTEFGVPSYLLNRRKDRETGRDIHLVGNDLDFAKKQDIEREKTLYTWRGFRHIYGKKVRGQRTRTTGRRGMTVGVQRKGTKAPQKKEKK